ncbi:MAG: hypothetical protein K2P78_02045 [Gemmataceae bacterium]|nr:hypothetical protein [Gemmataceae bacterium]
MQTLLAVSPVLAELTTRGWFPLWLAIPLAVVGAAGVGVLYALEAGRLGTAPRVVMAALRMAIVAAVAFLLLRPVWAYETHADRRRPVAVMIDVSQSMNHNDPRGSAEDQWRAAIAFNLADPDPKTIHRSDTDVFDKLPGGAASKPTRIEVARAVLTNPKIDLINRLDAVGPVELYTFGSRRDGRDAGDRKWVKDLTGTDPHTGLADQVAELLARDPDDLPAAIVVVTDGRENHSQKTTLDQLAERCKQLRVPLHVYGVGSSGFGQLQVKGIDIPEGVFVEDAVAVPVRFRVDGVADGTATVELRYGDRDQDPKGHRKVAEKTVPLAGGPKDRVETLVFVPTREDAAAERPVLTATVTINPKGGGVSEIPPESVAKGVRVVDRKLKVLVIDSIPRFDFKYLQRALLRDRRVEARFVLTDGDPESMASGPPWQPELAQMSDGELSLSEEEFRKLLFTYDLLILGDVPGKYLNQRHQDVVKAFITEGGGLIHVAGRWNAPAGWAGGPIADVLPVDFDAVKFPVEELRRPDPFYPVVQDAAARSPLVTLEDEPLDNAELWGKMGQVVDGTELSLRGRKLPPLYWHYPVTKLKPAAEAYLVHPRKRTTGTDPKPMPLLAGHYFGKGFVLFVGFDESWRWRFNEADKYFGRFWSQSVYVAGVPRIFGNKLTQLSINTADPILGSPKGEVRARIFSQDFLPHKAEKATARLELLDAAADDPKRVSTITLEPLAGQPGEFVAPLPFDRPGRFRLSVDPGNDSPAGLEYRVSLPPNHEQSGGPMDGERMQKLAADTGGKFYREENLAELPRAVEAKFVPVATRHETVLWNVWALAALVVLMTIEWVVRKLNSLS